MKKFVLLILIILTYNSCEEPVDWLLDDQITPRLVVEAMITNIPGMNYVKLSLPVRNPNRTPQSVSNATVVFMDGANYNLLTEDPDQPGLYIPDPGLQGVVNKIYWLYIAIGDDEFAGGAYMVPVSPLKKFTYYDDPGNPGYYRILPRESDTPAYTEYKIEWEEPDGRIKESVFYTYKLSTLDVNQFFKPEAETLSFPAGARIIRIKYSLSPDHEKYLRSLLSETDWRGGWFDVMHGNLHTNLNNDAVGFFAASSVVRDTVYFD